MYIEPPLQANIVSAHHQSTNVFVINFKVLTNCSFVHNMNYSFLMDVPNYYLKHFNLY